MAVDSGMDKHLAAIMEGNREAYDNHADGFGTLRFFPAEMLVLERFREQWSEFSLLDLGVGVGRTTWMLSQQARRYRGLDYAENRIRQCQALFPTAEHRSFEVVDVRKLSTVDDGEIDFVNFSYNGIDYVDPEGREKALSEINRVLKPGGWFFFSSHSLQAYPFRQVHPRRLRGILTPLGWIFCFLANRRMSWKNRHISPADAREQGWACLFDYSSEMLTYYGDPELQKRQLTDHGFELDSAWDMKGNPFEFSNSPEDWMIQYLAQKAG